MSALPASVNACVRPLGRPNLLAYMGLNRLILSCFLVLVSAGAARSQSQAALEKLHQRYSPEVVEDMQVNTHYKYAGLLLYYSSSFLVNDHGQLRAATEEEIAAVDLVQYDRMRSTTDRVGVRDAPVGKELILLGRDEFEQVVMAHLNAVDHAAFLAYKAAATGNTQVKQP